jgi:hypothetical protein
MKSGGGADPRDRVARGAPTVIEVRDTRPCHAEVREIFPAISGVFAGCRAPEKGRSIYRGYARGAS